MKYKFHLDGIKCRGCVARVKKSLEKHHSIERAEIFLVPKGATTISMKYKLSTEDIQRQLNKFHGYMISEIWKPKYIIHYAIFLAFRWKSSCSLSCSVCNSPACIHLFWQ